MPSLITLLSNSSSVFRDVFYHHKLDSLKIILYKIIFGYESIIILEFICLFYLFHNLQKIISNIKIKKTVRILGSIFFTFQLLSFYLIGNFIDYRFIINFDLNNLPIILSLFYFEILFFLIILILLIYFWKYSEKFKFLNKILEFRLLKLLKIRHFINFICIIYLLISSTFIDQTLKVINYYSKQHQEVDFQKALKLCGFSDYKEKYQIKGIEGKNIIIISLESLEIGFLDNKFKAILPFLNSLRKDTNWHLMPINQNDGSNWTSGSLYTCLTGLPAYFGSETGTIFNSVYNCRIPSISALTHQLNYENKFFIGNANFGGTKEMVNILNFDHIFDIESQPNLNSSGQFGLHDFDVFDLAKKELLKQSKNRKFLYFLSTTDTHFPNGIPDNRFKKDYGNIKDQYSYTLKCLDSELADFIHFLYRNIDMQNTAVFILPDHQKMGNSNILDQTGNRQLYLLSNQNLNYDSSKTYFQIDIAPNILKAANIKHNITFLTDIIKGSKLDYINSKCFELMTLNTNGIYNLENRVNEYKKSNPDYNKIIKNKDRFIAHAGGSLDGKLYTNSLNALDSSYANGYKLFELDLIYTSDHKIVACHDWNKWKELTEYSGNIPPTEKEFLNQKILKKYNPLNVDEIKKWFLQHKDAILITDKIDNPTEIVKLFPFRNRIWMELFTNNSIDEAIQLKIGGILITENLVNTMSKMRLKHLKNNGVNYIACSRNMVNKYPEKLDYLKSIGYKCYFYNINTENKINSGINEDYVLKYDLEHGYGIYADFWKFK